MKSHITTLFSKLKPRPREILGVGITFILFFAIALLVNAFRSEPLNPWGAKVRVERVKVEGKSVDKDNNEKKVVKWEYCDATAVDSLIKKDDALIIDARPGLFYKMGHIPGAKSLPATTKDLNGEIRKILSNEELNRPIVVYCADKNCENAETVARQIVQLDYDQVFIFSGGWAEWEKSGREIEK